MTMIDRAVYNSNGAPAGSAETLSRFKRTLENKNFQEYNSQYFIPHYCIIKNILL